MPRVADAIRFAVNLGIDPRDAEHLIAHGTKNNRTWVAAHPESNLSSATAHRITKTFLRRASGYPLAYLIGVQDFFGLEFRVTPSVLIPRPETELLVEEALRRIPLVSHFRIADIGTGSGVIAVTLAVHRPKLSILAIDASPRALAVAKQNAKAHGVTRRVQFKTGNLLAPIIRHRFDAIVANLPYLPSGPLPLFEPTLALRGGRDGLKYFRIFFRQLKTLPYPVKFILLEIDPRNLRGLGKLVPKAYHVTVLRDLAGRDRLVLLEPSTSSRAGSAGPRSR